jgi:chemotaxis protein MotB
VERQLAEKGLRISNLLIELERRERELAELRRVERYRSEFFGALKDVFTDNPNIKVVGDRFVFQAEVFFPSGSADIGEEGKAELQKFVQTWKSMQDRIPSSVPINIQIQGHTDVRPIYGRYASNWELSTARANEVVGFLIANGLPPDMLSAAGFSKYYPAVPGDTPEAYRQNRRIEIRITAR